ncbi:MAG TPA: polysaccharide biosynthesis tyrosine autokinase [Candidatus Binatia bacterium]|nr:polysaccharide biosynthesis tyrosine autokinase [Candidatus Binatia bacterium]
MELTRYLRLLGRWWWLLVLATGLAAASSFVAVSQQVPVYQSKTTLMLGSTIDDPNPSGNEINLTQQLAGLYADIANRQVVREKTMEALGLDSLPDYEARPLPNSQLIEIVVTDVSPERAQAVANELANQLILQSPTAPDPEEQDRQAFINDQLATLQTNIEDTEDEIAQLEVDLENAFSAREIETLQLQISGLQSKLNTLQSNYAALYSRTQGGAINAVTVIEPAALPQRPIGGGNLMTVLTASIIGLVLAGGAVYVIDYLEDSLRTAEEVKRYTGLPALPGIADFGSEDSERKLITRAEPLSPIAEAFRALRTAVRAASPDGRVILVTSPKPGEGKSITAGNLAVVMAQAGHKVLLIDADLRRPVQHKLLNVRKDRGITDILMVFHLKGHIANMQELLDSVIRDTPEHGLQLLPSGAQVPNSHMLLGSDAVPMLLNILRKRYDYIILDSPPVLAVTDAVALSTVVDGVLLMTDASTIRRRELKHTIERLKNVKANILGISLNRLDPKSEGYYSPYFEYYSQNTDRSSKEPPGMNNGVDGDARRRWLRRLSAHDDAAKLN